MLTWTAHTHTVDGAHRTVVAPFLTCPEADAEALRGCATDQTPPVGPVIAEHYHINTGGPNDGAHVIELRACSRDDDPTQHDEPRAVDPELGSFLVDHPEYVRPQPVSPWARRAIAHQLPPSAHGSRAYAR